jgi:hypothetical protein
MIRKTILLCLSAFLLLNNSDAQFSRYIVKFSNKGGNSFSLNTPAGYLSARAIARRTRYSTPIDSTDLPVTTNYLNAIKAIAGVTVLNTSKWLNAVAIQTYSPTAITSIQALPFVQSVSGIAAKQIINDSYVPHNKFDAENIVVPLPPSNNKGGGLTGDYFDYGTSSANEIKLHHGEFLHNIGLRGQGMQIAVLDAGFYNYTSLKAFDSIIANGQVLNTWDFVSGHASVTEDDSHGMMCLSTIAANIPGQFIGKAPKASFYLFRTEDANSEYPIEEFNWVCGAERADSAGADVITSSLGYYDFDNAVFNYSYSQLNGNTTISSKGADLAAKKGLMVLSAVGNEGNVAWRYLITPSDGDSVIAVGAVNATGVTGSFSSYGPSADGRVKPDMASVGVYAVVQSIGNYVGTANGTSFATPNLAGLSTCLWQGFPEFNCMKIYRAMRESSSQYANPDNRQGYGIPNMKLAFSKLLADYATATGTITNCNATINWNSKDMSAMLYEVERKLPTDIDFTKIATINPKGGATLSNQSYSFTDALSNLAAGNILYRIKQTIDSSSASKTSIYIDTLSIALTTGCYATTNNTTLSLRPNPLHYGTSQLLINTADAIPNLTISVYNSIGQLIKSWNVNKPTGSYLTPISLEAYSDGEYLIKVVNNELVIGTVKAIKQ